MNDDTEIAWFKTLTMGQVGTLVAFIFISGGVWFSLNDKAAAADAKAEENSVKIRNIEQDISAIKTDVEVTKNEVKNLSKGLDRALAQQAEILRILRKGND